MSVRALARNIGRRAFVANRVKWSHYLWAYVRKFVSVRYETFILAWLCRSSRLLLFAPVSVEPSLLAEQLSGTMGVESGGESARILGDPRILNRLRSRLPLEFLYCSSLNPRKSRCVNSF